MNSALKSLLLMAIAIGALVYGIYLHKSRQIAGLETDLSALNSRSKELAKEITVLRAKAELAQEESQTAAGFEATHKESEAVIAAEMKRIDELAATWQQLDTERVAAVKKARETSPTLAPARVTLTDGTVLENLVVLSVPNENTISVEHSNGLVKLTAEKLPADLKDRLGLGWTPAAPGVFSVDKNGIGSVTATDKPADTSSTVSAPAPQAEDLQTVTGLTRAIASTEAKLASAQKEMNNERANIRRLNMFKSDMKAANDSRTYGALKKEANLRLAKQAQKVLELQSTLDGLKHRLKGL